MAGYRVRQERINEGLCYECGEPRGDKGTSTRCRKHAKMHNSKQARRLAAVRNYRRANHLCTECGERLAGRKATLCRVHLLKDAIAKKRQRTELVTKHR